MVFQKSVADNPMDAFCCKIRMGLFEVTMRIQKDLKDHINVESHRIPHIDCYHYIIPHGSSITFCFIWRGYAKTRVLKIDDYDAPSRDKSLGFGLAPGLGG
jgi:hypothetical protein